MDKRLIYPQNYSKERDIFFVKEDRNYLIKQASGYHPEVQKYINDVKAIPNLIQVLITALGAFENWGCFPQGTQVMTACGYHKNIEEIEEGDIVYTHKSANKKVIRPMDRWYDGKLLNFDFVSWHTDFWCTVEHPILSLSNVALVEARTPYYRQKESYDDFIDRLKYDFIPANKLLAGDWVCVPFPKETVTCEEIADKDLAFLLGWYLAEGTLIKAYNKPHRLFSGLVFTIGMHEMAVAEKIKDIHKKYGKLVTIKENYGGVKCIRVESFWGELASLCGKHLGRGSRLKFISNDVLRMPLEWQRVFISAYLDGYGHQVKKVGRYYGAITSSTASPQLCMSLAKISARFGYAPSCIKLKQHDSTFGAGNPIYENAFEMNFSGELLVDRFFKSAKKYSGIRTHLDSKRGYILIKIKEISEKDYIGPVYNMEVESDNSYCVGGVAVHNCNVNGDAFKQRSLEHKGDDYGHQTFQTNANYFIHHVNKDPSLAKGKVLLAVWNEKTKRVELVVGIDPKLDPDAASEIDAGNALAFSMGSKLPYDVCSICGNKAKTRAEYCDHLRYMLKQFDEATGKLIYADNPYPKFFDISRVLIPADKTAYMWEKIASPLDSPYAALGSAYLAQLPAGKIADVKYLQEKVAEMREAGKVAQVNKKAFIKKQIPVMATPAAANLDKILPAAKLALDATSPTIPAHVFNGFNLSQILTTLVSMGIFPKNEECRSLSKVFLPDEKLEINSKNFSTPLGKALLPFVESRSTSRPMLLRRLIILAAIPKKELLAKVASEAKPSTFHAGLTAGILAALYAIMKANPSGGPGLLRVIADHPFLTTILGTSLLNAYRASTAGENAPVGQVSLADQNAPLYNNDWQRRFVDLQKHPVTVIKTGAVREKTNTERLFDGISLSFGAYDFLKEANPQQPVASFISQNPDLFESGLLNAKTDVNVFSSHVKSAMESAASIFKDVSLEHLEFLETIPAGDKDLIWDLAILNAAQKLAI